MDLTEMAMLARWLKIPLVNGLAAGIFMCTCRLVTGRQGRLSRKILKRRTRNNNYHDLRDYIKHTVEASQMTSATLVLRRMMNIEVSIVMVSISYCKKHCTSSLPNI